MAIEFKSEEQRKIEKQAKKPKTKLEKARKAMFILTIIFSVFSFCYFFIGFNPAIVVFPLLVFWLLIILVPTVCTIGLVWAIEGYRNFAAMVTNWLATTADILPSLINGLKIGLPIVGSVTLATIATYGILSFLLYRKNKQNNKGLAHFIVAIVLFVLILVLFILAIIFFEKVLTK